MCEGRLVCDSKEAMDTKTNLASGFLSGNHNDETQTGRLGRDQVRVRGIRERPTRQECASCARPRLG